MPKDRPKALVTGAGGFVGPYLARHLRGLGYDVYGGTLSGRASEDYTAVTLDVRQADAVKEVARELAPDDVYHLAGITRPALGLVSEFYEVNLHGTLNVLEAAKEVGAATLVVSSAYVYGAHEGRIAEDAPLKPVNHYGASKAAGDLAALPYALEGGRVVRVRPFNHVGPGQSPDFLLPTLVGQLAKIEAGELPPVIKLGNLDAARDFTDVRDVVRAYPKLLHEGENGEVYNLASGRGVTVRELAEQVTARARLEVRLEVEPARVRATDIPSLVGDASKARERVGWRPEIPLERTLDEMLAFERGVRDERPAR